MHYTGHTKPEIRQCTSCGKEFLAPIEDSICHLPDGGIVSYPDPILECPLCDQNQFGYYLNKEFMDI